MLKRWRHGSQAARALQEQWKNEIKNRMGQWKKPKKASRTNRQEEEVKITRNSSNSTKKGPNQNPYKGIIIAKLSQVKFRIKS